jgi:predicted DNA-binding transcriptional regulator AlpA
MSDDAQRDFFSSNPPFKSDAADEEASAINLVGAEGLRQVLPSRQKRVRKGAYVLERNHLTVKEVASWYGVGVATIWRWIKELPDFPHPHKITPGSSRWFRRDLEAYDDKLRRQKR